MSPFIMVLALLAGTIPAFSQSLSIDIGSAAESVCTGSKYGSAQQPDMVNQAAPFNTLRYGSTVTCNIPAPIGTCTPTLQFFENRPAVATATLPASGIGTRVFTVSVNGSTPITVDIFAAVGAQKSYSLPIAPVTVTDGFVHVNLVASKGNASISGVVGACVPAQSQITLNCLRPLVCAFDPASNTYTAQFQPDPQALLGGATVAGSFLPGTVLVVRKAADGRIYMEGAVPATLSIMDPLTLGLPPMLVAKPQ